MSAPHTHDLKLENTFQTILYFNSEIKNYQPGDSYLIILENKYPQKVIAFEEAVFNEYPNAKFIFVGIGVEPEDRGGYLDVVRV